MKTDLSTNAQMALDRARRAYEAAQVQTNARSLNRAENRFYAATEALYHVLVNEHSAADAAEQQKAPAGDVRH